MKFKYSGSCLCGGVKYSGESQVPEYGFCHCESCKKASGSAFSANIGVDSYSFVVDDPKSFLKEFESSSGTHRFFCSNCGSPVFSKIDDIPEFVRIRLGTLDTDFDAKPSRHTFTNSKASWYEICDTAARFEEKAY